MKKNIQNNLFNITECYPSSVMSDRIDDRNPAIKIFGRRFYKDQSFVEYVSEFLLAFSSKKLKQGGGEYKFTLIIDDDKKYNYWPESRIILKLFAFFSNSKLETRHEVHREVYLEILNNIKKNISCEECDKSDVVNIIQSLIGGFVGVSKDRSWVTCTFLPIVPEFLAREVSWEHSRAVENNVKTWSQSEKYFDISTHNFMGRGGELIFLQLTNLFDSQAENIVDFYNNYDEYHHTIIDKNNTKIKLCEQQIKLENLLSKMLSSLSDDLKDLLQFIESSFSGLQDYEVSGTGAFSRPTRLGWVPVATNKEAFLLAHEMVNILSSDFGVLDKADFLQTLFIFHVLRSLCFQSVRVLGAKEKMKGFIGGYSLIVCDSELIGSDPSIKMSRLSSAKIESILFRVLRSVERSDKKKYSDKELKNGDENCYKMFRKFGKNMGFIIPRYGKGQRFTLHQGLIRFLVAALIRPGEKIRLDTFYERLFAHYGIAVGGKQLIEAMKWLGIDDASGSYAITANTTWLEEALQQGGFLVELSDAISMVQNPAAEQVISA